MDKIDEQYIREHFGDPAEISRGLRLFGRSTRALDRQYSKFVELYAGQWVALYDGKLRAHGPAFEDVLQKLDQEGVPREHTLVRFIDNDDRIMIL